MKKVATYTEGNNTIELMKVDTLTKVEVRLFLYFLLKKEEAGIPPKKAMKFKAYLDLGQMPEEMGVIIPQKGQGFCIRETHPGYYVLYVAENGALPLNSWVRKALKRVKR